LKVDATAAAYGLVQVVFAHVTERLATAVFVLKQKRACRGAVVDLIWKLDFLGLQLLPRRQRDRPVTVEQIYRMEFKRLLDAFRDELKHLDRQAESNDLSQLRDACTELSAVSRWRNDRIHARVRPVDDRLALYDRVGKRLSISQDECVGIAERLTKVIVTLEVHLSSVVKDLDFDKAWNEFFAQLDKAEADVR
jgi:hypothetical protein